MAPKIELLKSFQIILTERKHFESTQIQFKQSYIYFRNSGILENKFNTLDFSEHL